LNAGVYPNPATDHLTIGGLTTGSQLRVLDVVGREVLSATSIDAQHMIDVNALTEGNYVLQIIFDGKLRAEKFSVRR
jgi:hypothetical protein